MPRPTAVLHTNRSTQATSALLAAIESGRWPHMARLPGEIHLAEEFGVARGTMRRALAQLTAQGRLLRRPHAGFIVPSTGPGAGALTGTILLIGVNGAGFPYAEEYPAAVLIGAQRGAAAIGAHLMLVASERWDEPTRQALLAQRPSAVVMSDIFNGDHASAGRICTALAAAQIPLVWHADPDDGLPCTCVCADQGQGARLLVDHLRRHGRTSPVMLTTYRPGLPWAAHRQSAIAATWGADVSRVAIEIEARTDGRDEGNFRRRTRTYAGYLAELTAGSQRPDALLLSSDSDIPVVTAACRLVGFKPGQDIDILGFDGYWGRLWETAFEAQPPLATVRTNHEHVGRRLIELAMQSSRGGSAAPSERIPSVLVTQLE